MKDSSDEGGEEAVDDGVVFRWLCRWLLCYRRQQLRRKSPIKKNPQRIVERILECRRVESVSSSSEVNIEVVLDSVRYSTSID